MSISSPGDNKIKNTVLKAERLHEYGDHNQTIVFSETGGNIISWKYRGVNIFHPQQKMRNETRPSGGAHICFPSFGSADSRFGLPRYGLLYAREADYVTDNGVFFRGRNLLGPMHDMLCHVNIALALREHGFTYSISFKRCEPRRPISEPIFVNAGLRTYFRTPMHEAVVTGRFMPTSRIFQQRIKPRYNLADRSVDITIPGLGMVQMHLFGAMWGPAILKTIGLWRSSKKYLCIEHMLAEPRLYGKPICPRLVTNKQCLVLGCEFEVRLA